MHLVIRLYLCVRVCLCICLQILDNAIDERYFLFLKAVTKTSWYVVCLVLVQGGANAKCQLCRRGWTQSLRLCVLRKPDIDLFFCCGMTVWSFLKANGTTRGLGVQKTNFSKPGT